MQIGQERKAEEFFDEAEVEAEAEAKAKTKAEEAPEPEVEVEEPLLTADQLLSLFDSAIAMTMGLNPEAYAAQNKRSTVRKIVQKIIEDHNLSGGLLPRVKAKNVSWKRKLFLGGGALLFYAIASAISAYGLRKRYIDIEQEFKEGKGKEEQKEQEQEQEQEQVRYA